MCRQAGVEIRRDGVLAPPELHCLPERAVQKRDAC